MRINLRNEHRHRLYAVQVDLEDPPTVVRPPLNVGPTIHLDWDRALDDEQHLRRCPACGCEDLFVRKRVPQLTGFVLILLAAVLAMVLFGIGQVGLALLVLLFVLGVDVMIYLFARRVLVCYRCHSEFSGMPLSPHHPAWENAVSERYPAPPKRKLADVIDKPAGSRSPARSASQPLDRHPSETVSR